jgi:formate-dependent nitrite reductase membrane component NrfD
MAEEQTGPSYYGVPAIHKSHWKWLIINYFFLGGISSASYVIAAVAGMRDREENRAISRVGHYVSFAAFLPCPILLILDLGRPERFLNMVRHFNPRSPMSLGTWGVLAFSFFSGSSAAAKALEDGFLGVEASDLAKLAPSNAFGAVGTGPAFFVGGYTGVLLGATSVPIWAKSANMLGPLFLSSAFSSASSAILLALATSGADEKDIHRVEEIKRLAIASEIALLAVASKHLGETGRPLREGQVGRIMKIGVVGAGIVAPLTLQLFNRKRQSRRLTVAGAVLGLSGGFALRYSVVMAGHASADDPHATFDFAR